MPRDRLRGSIRRKDGLAAESSPVDQTAPVAEAHRPGGPGMFPEPVTRPDATSTTENAVPDASSVECRRNALPPTHATSPGSMTGRST